MDFRVLGPVEVADGADAVPIGGPRQRALLALLALDAGRIVGVDRLVDELWPTTEAPVEALQTAVSRLRRSLGPGVTIAGRAGGYVLEAPIDDVDALRFVRLFEEGRAAAKAGDAGRASTMLDAALAEWRGPPLADVEPGTAAPSRARLSELRLQAMEDRVDADLELGRHHDLLAELDELTRDHPLRERLWGQRILALYRSGRQADALRDVQRLRAVLRDEVGLEPGPELRRLEADVLAQAPELAWHAPAVVGDGGRSLLTAMLDDPDTAALVGRHAELDVLVRSWKDVLAGGRRAVLVTGEPGIGKTRLAAEIARRAQEDGALIAYGRCDEDLAVPFQPFAEALAQCERALPPDVIAAAITAAPELATLLPGPTAPAAPDDGGRPALFRAVTSLFDEVTTRRPLLLVLDDVHWADEPTLLLLRSVLRSPSGCGLLVVATFRDVVGPLARLLPDPRREPHVDRLDLRGLELGGVAELVEALGVVVDDGVTDSVHRETAGNPFFVIETARELVAGRPAGPTRAVRDLVHRRVARLDDDARRLLTVAAVAGPVVDVAVLRHVGPPGDAWLDAIDAAVAGSFLVEVPDDAYAFTHALVRDALLADVSRARRGSLHRQVLDALVVTGGSTPDVDRLAHHAIEAARGGEPVVDEAVTHTLAAATRALDGMAFETAIGLAERALALGGVTSAHRAELLLVLGHGKVAIGDFDEARTIGASAADAARAAGSPECLARVAILHRALVDFAAAGTDVPALCAEAIAQLDDGAVGLRSRVLATWVVHDVLGGREREPALRRSDEALALARTVDELIVRNDALYARISALTGLPGLEERLALNHEYLEVATAARHRRAVVEALAARAVTRLELGDWAGFVADRSDMRARGSDDVGWASRLRGRWLEVTEHIVAGRFEDAAAASDELLALGGDDVDAVNAYAAEQLVLHHERGRLADLLPMLEGNDADRLLPAFKVARAFARADLGDLVGARPVFDELVADIGAVPPDVAWPAALVMLAETCARLADRERAGQLLSLVEPHAGHVVVAGQGAVCLGAYDRYLAMLTSTLGRIDEAIGYYESALALERALGSDPFVARTSLWYGRLLLSTDGPSSGPALLGESALAAERLGMTGVYEEATALLV